MPKRKIDALCSIPSPKDAKEIKYGLSRCAEGRSKTNLFADDDSESKSEDESEDGGAPLEEQGFKINNEYAKRFEHNKKREELHRRG